MKKILLTVTALIAVLVFAALMPVNAKAEAAEEEAGLAITVQPEDVDVEYPGGAEFHVEVSDPDLVASYQWILSDGTQDFVMKGTSACTDTLIIPSTEQDCPDEYLRCVITDIDGNVIESEEAAMRITNHEEDLTVLFICDYAIRPGESLDLAETGYGTGVITFEEDGCTVTLDNADFSTENIISDMQLSPSLGLFLQRRHTENLEYYFNLVGDNRITDTFYDPEYNSAGVVFNTHFAVQDDEDPPTVILCGDGSLTLIGGTNSIYSLVNVEIDADLTTYPNGLIYNDAVTCLNFYAGEGAVLDLNCNGTAIRARGDARISDAAISINSTAPHVSVGSTAKSIVNADGSIYLDSADISIAGYADPECFVPYDAYLGNFTAVFAGGNINIDNSRMAVKMTAGESDTDFMISGYGVCAEGESSAISFTGSSALTVDMDLPKVLFVGGVIATGLFTAEEDCAVEVNLISAGETLGVEADRAFEFTDATLLVTVSTTAEDAITFGAVGGGFAYDAAKAGPFVYIRADQGVAMAMDTGDHGEFEVVPEEGYEPVLITLGEGVTGLVPEAYEVNLFGAPAYGETARAEAIYDSNDLNAPAGEIFFVGGDLLDTVLEWFR